MTDRKLRRAIVKHLRALRASERRMKRHLKQIDRWMKRVS